jgi:Uma2 family endonuclease
MGLPAEKHTMTLEEFLTWEAEQPERWEFFKGEAFMMAGGSDVHNLVTGNLYMALRLGLQNTRCNVFMSDVRLRLAEDDSLFYPDVFVTCSDADRARRQVKEDPVLIAEVLSPSTEAYDRGDKFAAYRRFPGLKTVLLLSQDRAHVECYTRDEDGRWILSEASGDTASLALPAFGFDLALADLYRNLPDTAPAPDAPLN